MVMRINSCVTLFCAALRILRRQWRNKRGQHIHECRQLSLYKTIDQVVIHSGIFVAYHISKSYDTGPWNFWMRLFERNADASGGLSQDFQFALHGQSNDKRFFAVSRKLFKSQALHEPHDRLRRFKHIPKIGRIAFLSSHRSPRDV